MAAPASDWLRHFRLFPCNGWVEFVETWQEARTQHPLPTLRFWADRKNKMDTPTFDWLRYFRLLWNRWMEFAGTWQEATTQHPLPNLCFRAKRKAKDCYHDLWLADTFSTIPLEPLNWISWNLTRSKYPMSSTNFVIFSEQNKNNRLAVLSRKVAHCTRVWSIFVCVCICLRHKTLTLVVIF